MTKKASQERGGKKKYGAALTEIAFDLVGY